jgi:uncharacterized cupredoxin-like copper-binding protein
MKKIAGAAVILLAIVIAFAWLFCSMLLRPASSSVNVKVEFTDGAMTVDSPSVRLTHRIVFEIRNDSKEQHHFVVAQTDFPPEKMPLKDGKVRYFTYPGEPRLTFREHGGLSEVAAPGTAPTWNRQEPGIKVEPGQTVVFREVFVYDLFKRGTRFVLFCNEPGHYERGEYAGITVN